jgi:hypothetical protein
MHLLPRVCESQLSEVQEGSEQLHRSWVVRNFLPLAPTIVVLGSPSQNPVNVNMISCVFPVPNALAETTFCYHHPGPPLCFHYSCLQYSMVAPSPTGIAPNAALRLAAHTARQISNPSRESRRRYNSTSSVRGPVIQGPCLLLFFSTFLVTYI